MRKSLFTEAQIIGILKQAEAGRMATDLCREHGITQATFYRWRSKVRPRPPHLSPSNRPLLICSRRLLCLLPSMLADARWNQLHDAHQAGATMDGSWMRSR